MMEWSLRLVGEVRSGTTEIEKLGKSTGQVEQGDLWSAGD